jgi:hypothetical protein
VTTTINSSVIEGGGTLPKDININSVVYLDASGNDGKTFEWEFVALPESSAAVIRNPNSSTTRVGPLDKKGVYQIKLTIDRNAATQKVKTLALNVPGQKSILPIAGEPAYDTGGRVRNFSFELPGALAGYAEGWDTRDDAGILNSFAGIVRGRCTPTNFQLDSGNYAMVLGDDIGGSIPNTTGAGGGDIPDISRGDVFAVTQEIDLTDVDVLNVEIKFDV